jgi:hypothetical protein
MYNSRTLTALYYTVLGFLIIFSFFTFSEQFYPLLNSDMAVNILMTPGFNIPGDLYFWGQDRGGSLIPMLAHILCSTYFFPPILAVSVVHFFILIAGFSALATLFKDRTLKLALALVWFFPCWHFLDHVLLLFGIQMSMLAISIYFLNRISRAQRIRFNLLWLSMACLSFIAAVWVSDLAILSLPAYLLGITFIHRKTLSWSFFGSFFKEKRNLLQLAVPMIWFVIGTGFILYAKSKAVKIESYNHGILNNFGEIAMTIRIMTSTLWQVLKFASENVIESIYVWAILIGTPWIIILSKKKKDPSQTFTQQRWLVFFLLNGIVALFFVVLSHWVFINGVGRRYFTIVYISIGIFFLLFLQANGSRNRSLRLMVLFVMILIGTFSSFSKFYFPKRIPPRTEVLSELKTLGNIGIIAEYWNAYLSASPDPNRIKATPHDKDYVRNQYLAQEVFRQPSIYLIKDCWLNSFPDTIQQFGHILTKKGDAFHLADCNLCRYIPLLLHEEFTWKEMKYQGTIDKDAEARNGQSVRIGPGFDKSKHFVYGPFISLAPGKVVVKFRIKSSENLSTGVLAILDVSTDYGKTVLAKQTILSCDFGRPNAFQEFEIPLDITRKIDGTEFRILYLGTANLTFDRVVVQGI